MDSTPPAITRSCSSALMARAAMPTASMPEPHRRLTVVPVILLAFPRWQVQDVQVDGCPKLPASTVNSLHELVGQPALGLDVTAIRDAVEVWPGVGEVAVELELPGTVRVRAKSTPIFESVRVGRSIAKTPCWATPPTRPSGG